MHSGEPHPTPSPRLPPWRQTGGLRWRRPQCGSPTGSQVTRDIWVGAGACPGQGSRGPLHWAPCPGQTLTGPSPAEGTATTGMFRGPQRPVLVGGCVSAGRAHPHRPRGTPAPDGRRPQAAGPEAAAGCPAGLHGRLRVRGGPHALRGAGAAPAEPCCRLEAPGPAGPVPAPRGGRLPALLGQRPSGPREEEARQPAAPGAQQLCRPLLPHCRVQSLPGASEKGGGGVCPEGWACRHIVVTRVVCELVSMEMGGRRLCHLLRHISQGGPSGWCPHLSPHAPFSHWTAAPPQEAPSLSLAPGRALSQGCHRRVSTVSTRGPQASSLRHGPTGGPQR